MTIIIDKPSNLDKDLLGQLIDMVEAGGQIQRPFIERGVSTAELIAFMISGHEILCSATLKNPLPSYRDDVFKGVGVEDFDRDELPELGYAVTNPKYEGRKLCQELFSEFFKVIGNRRMYAVTRKPAMVHILQKFGFDKLGGRYKEDFEVFVYDGTTR